MNQLHINTDLKGERFYKVYNGQGGLVFSGKLPVDNQVIDVSGLSNGIYFFKMESQSFRLIKE